MDPSTAGEADAAPSKKRPRRSGGLADKNGGEATNGLASNGSAANGSAEDVSQLPIQKHRDEILRAVEKHRVVVVIGETGSGKTTQVPQFLHQAGYSRQGVIAVTQPRRIAAISVATRVAAEMQCKLGGLVGYHVRFVNHTTRETRLKYMTDGMLVRESASNVGLASCSVVVLDEAHERSIHTDVLLGLVRCALESGKQPDLRVMVMSATLDAAPFVNFFGGPKRVKLITVPGRQHPVQVFYTPQPEPDFLEAALIAVLQLHLLRPAGDVLVFLPGQEDIDGLQRLLEEKREALAGRRREAPREPLTGPPGGAGIVLGGCERPLPPAGEVGDFVVRPIFASLPFDQQQRVFEVMPPGCRKIILATNIAETSITIPGIRYVVDTGLMKLKICHPQTGVEMLKLVETSQASAGQRAGRAGREAPGQVYRLYMESEYAKMPPQTPAEILRCDMASVYLQLKALGVNDVPRFPLVDRPPKEALVKAAHFLSRIGAIDTGNALSEIGRKLALMPIPPLYAYCLLMSTEFECVAEMLSIVAMLSAEATFFTTRRQKEVAPARKPLQHQDGDHLTLLSIFSSWKKEDGKRAFAQRHSLNHSALERAATIRDQLKELVQNGWGQQISSCGGSKNWVVVRRCLLKACFTQTARRDDVSQHSFTTFLSRQVAKLHPTCVLFRRTPPPACVVYSELVTTTKNYLRTVTEVDPAWLVELCPKHFAAGGCQ